MEEVACVGLYKMWRIPIGWGKGTAEITVGKTEQKPARREREASLCVFSSKIHSRENDFY